MTVVHMLPMQQTSPADSPGALNTIARWLRTLRGRRERSPLEAVTRHLSRELLRDIGLEPHPDDLAARPRRYL